MNKNRLAIPIFQASDDLACCGAAPPPPASDHERAGYKICRYVDGFLDTAAGPVPRVSSQFDWFDRGGAVRARVGLLRDSYRISPGLYCLGHPGPEAPVLVTANYKLTFDFLRRDLAAQDVWILVLDTRGINVWCAAAHKTFGTAALLQGIQASALTRVVTHRQLIVPQLGASGVDALALRKSSGFEVIWGPVRSGDLPEFLANSCEAKPAMRKVTFTIGERLVLVPVEMAMAIKPSLVILAVMLVLSGLGPGFFGAAQAWSRWLFFVPAYAVGLVTGAVLVPVLLPWLPFRAFYLKGLLVALPIAVAVTSWFGSPGWPEAVAQVLVCLTVSSYTAMNFTGATPYASPSGVEKEMGRAIPLQIVLALTALLFWLAPSFINR
jgi:hypothetical protein